jgi:hypothetical protein
MDDDIENVGIMQGFMDSMADEGDDEGDDDPEAMMERRPDTPEILMNNLRGDMRSLSARRDELADLVGYQAATETPELRAGHAAACAGAARRWRYWRASPITSPWPKGHSPR